MCQLAGVSRASYCRHWEAVAPDEVDIAVRAAIQSVALAHHRRCGYRRVVLDLRQKQGIIVNHKRVLRTMREDTCWRFATPNIFRQPNLSMTARSI